MRTAEVSQQQSGSGEETKRNRNGIDLGTPSVFADSYRQSTRPTYQSSPGQRFSGFVRTHLAVIEEQQVAGFALQDIHKEIAATTGYTHVSLASFKTALARARARRPRLPSVLSPTTQPTDEKEIVATAPIKVRLTQTQRFSYEAARAESDMTHILGPAKPNTK